MEANSSLKTGDVKVKKEPGTLNWELQQQIFEDKLKNYEEKYRTTCEARDEFRFEMMHYKQLYEKEVKENSVLQEKLDVKNLTHKQTETWALEAQVASLQEQLQEADTKLSEYRTLYGKASVGKEDITGKSLEKYQQKIEAEVASLQNELKVLQLENVDLKEKLNLKDKDISDLLKSKVCPTCQTSSKPSRQSSEPSQQTLALELKQERLMIEELKRKHSDQVEQLSLERLALEQKMQDQNIEIFNLKGELKRREVPNEVTAVLDINIKEEIEDPDDTSPIPLVPNIPPIKKESKGRGRPRKNAKDVAKPTPVTEISEEPASIPPLSEADAGSSRSLRKRLRNRSEKVAELTDKISQLDLKQEIPRKMTTRTTTRKKKVQDENDPSVDNEKPQAVKPASTRSRRKKAVETVVEEHAVQSRCRQRV